MKFIDGADVLTSQNEKVGSLDRVVLDPKSKDVTHLVIRKGFLLKEDKVLPLEAVDHVEDEKVILKRESDDFEKFPEFEETHYILANEIEGEKETTTRNAHPVLWYPPYSYSGVAQTPFLPFPIYYAEIQRNIPPDTIPLKKGAKVISMDGKHVGDVEEVLIDPKDERATHIVIEKGLFFPDRKLVPTIWFTNVLEAEVHLAMNASTLEKLPEYEG